MPLTALQNYILIEQAAQTEIQRLMPTPDYEGASRQKAQQISCALDRLYLMVAEQDRTSASLYRRNTGLTRINPSEGSEIDFASVHSMLNARISCMVSEILPYREQGMEFSGRRAGFEREISVAEALNISTNNPFNILVMGNWGPLWGKTRSLENVEKRIEQTLSMG
jgi:hypothetical protein